MKVIQQTHAIIFGTDNRLLIALYKDKKGQMSWQLIGTDVGDSEPEKALRKYLASAFTMPDSYTCGFNHAMYLYQNKKRGFCSVLYSVFFENPVPTIKNNEEIIELVAVSRDEVWRKKKFRGHPISKVAQKTFEYIADYLPEWQWWNKNKQKF